MSRVVYVVDLDVAANIASEYLPWLREHVRGMLALPGFLGADIFERLEPAPASGRTGYSVHYRLRDRTAFDDYLHGHAARMRAASSRFGDGVRAARGLLQTLE